MSSFTPTSAESIRDPQAKRRAQLRVFLGYPAGVGKTFRMLEEAQHLKRQGKDIVVGYFEPHGRKDTIATTVGLQMIPPKAIKYRCTTLKQTQCETINP